MKQNLVKILRMLFNKFFLVLFSGGNYPKTKNGSLCILENVLFECKIEENTSVNIPYDLRQVALGEYSYISRNSYVSNTTIGKFCSIGPNFCCGLGIHPTKGISTSPMFYSLARQNGSTLVTENKIEESKHTYIGNDVFVGANVTVLDGVNIGDGAVIGAGAVVTKDILPYAIAVGVPAKVIKYRFEQEQIEDMLKIKWWNFEESQLRDVENYFFKVNQFIKLHT